MNLTIHTIDTAPDESRPVLEGIEQDLGFVPNAAAAAAESPMLLAAFDGLRRAVGHSELAPVEREVAGLAVAVTVDNAYGVAFHSTVLSTLGVGDDEITSMRSGRPPGDTRLDAVYRVARSIAERRGRVDDETWLHTQSTGITVAEVLEIAAEATFVTMVGFIDNLADRVALDSFLEPRSWQHAL